MSQPRDDRQDDLFRPPLEEIINFRHPLVRATPMVGPSKSRPKTDLGIPCRSKSAKVVLGGYS